MSVVWKVRSDGVKQRFHLTPLRKDVVRLYKSGLSSRKVGGMLNISHARVLKILRSEDISRRPVIKPIINPSHKELTPSRAYLFGVMCGDGCIFSGREYKKKWSYMSHIVHLSVKDKDFLDEFVKNFQEVYGISPSVYYRDRKNKKWSNIWIARINRKLVYEDLAQYNFSNMWVVPDEIIESKDKRIICSFLRGVYDSEGSVMIGPRSATISFCSTNERGIKQIRKLISKVGIEISRIMENNNSLIKKPCYYFYITHSKNYLIFLREIGFSIKRKEDKLITYMKNLKGKNRLI